MARSAKQAFRSQRRAARAERRAIRAERKAERYLRQAARRSQKSIVDELENALSLDPLQASVPEVRMERVPTEPTKIACLFSALVQRWRLAVADFVYPA